MQTSTNSTLLELTDWIYEVPRDQKNISPSPRQLHTGVIYRDEWFIFGGFEQECPVDEFWVLSLVSKEWKQAKKSELKAWPLARHSHTSSLRTITVKGRTISSMIVFGGVTQNGALLNDVWEYSFRKSNWKKLETTGEVPAARWGHSAVIYQDEMWVFGGFTSSCNSELYCLNLGTLVWRKVTVEDGVPAGRHFHSANVYQDKIYIFGGLNIHNLGDLHSFHFGSQKWEKIEMKNSISKRKGHQSIIFDHYMIVHGGRDNKTLSNDLNFFDFDTFQWETIKVEDTAPTPRYYHCLGFWHNAMVVFGGLGVQRDDLALKTDQNIKYSNLNDLYYYSFKGNVFTDINSINGRFAMLPLDVLKYCLEFMKADTLAKLSCVNRFFYCVTSAENLWKAQVYSKSKELTFLSPSFLASLDDGFNSLKKKATTSNNNDNNDSKPISDAIQLDDLLAMMQGKMKPNIKQFYWKSQYVDKVVYRNGFSWKPERDSSQMHNGFTNGGKLSTTVNLVVFGYGGVGKTSSIIRFVQDVFIHNCIGTLLLLHNEMKEPRIEESFRKQVMLPETDIPVILDIVDTYGQEGLTIASNKCDLTKDREVFPQQALDLARKYDIPILEASAKDRINSEEQYWELLKEVGSKLWSKPAPTKKWDCDSPDPSSSTLQVAFVGYALYRFVLAHSARYSNTVISSPQNIVASQITALDDILQVSLNTPVCISVLSNDLGASQQTTFDSIQNATHGGVFQNYPSFHLANASMVVFETENYQEINYRSNDSTYYDIGNTNYWEIVKFYDGASEGAAMRNWPPNIKNTGNSKYGPAIRYDIAFTTAGKYKVWVRGRGCTGCNTTDGGSCKNCSADSNHDDSIHLLSRNSSSLSFVSYGNPANGLDTPWEWQSFPTLLQIDPSEVGWFPIRKSIYLAQRDDGIVVDKILISLDTNTSYSTLYGTGKGPSSFPFVNCSPDQLLYIPNENFTGVDSFSYTVSSGGQTSSALVQLYVGVALPSPTPAATPSTTPSHSTSPSVTPSTTTTPSTTPSVGSSPSSIPSQSASPTTISFQPSNSTDTRSNIGLVVGLLVASLMLVAGGGAFAYYMVFYKKSSTRPVHIEFQSLVSEQDQ